MKRKYLSAMLAAVAALALGLVSVGQASAATMGQPSNLAFLAIYGNPGTNAATLPVGGGIGRNFGFGENMVFQAGGGVGTILKITLLGKIAEAQETLIGGTLMSNKTGEGNALSFAIQSVDFQDSTLGGENTATYSDTFDRPWITEICGVKETGHETLECRVDPRITEAEGRTVKIEDASFVLKNAAIGTVVVQGTVWGKWNTGASKKAPCIELKPPPTNAGGDQTLIATQGGGFAPITTISGEACLVSANNDWFTVGVKNEPAITIKNE